MAGSVVAVWRTNRHARIERENEREELLAGKAYEAFFKLLDGYNFIGHLNREIDQMFDNASEDGDEDMEPSAKVMAIVGAEMPPEQIHASEVAFLIGEKNAELLNDVHLIQRRIANTYAVISTYNELSLEFQKFLEESFKNADLSAGTRMSTSLEGADATRAEMRISAMNNLLGQIMENLEQDIPESWRVLSEFNQVASERFGDKYPKFKLKRIDV